jgi:hypothetical protein
MTRASDDEAMKPLGPRLEPPRSWWVKWVVLAVFAVSVAVLPMIKWLLGSPDAERATGCPAARISVSGREASRVKETCLGSKEQWPMWR